MNFKYRSMKKYLMPFSLLILLAACGNNGNKNSTDESKDSTASEKPSSANDITSNPDYQKGLALISQSDCLTCHFNF